MADVNTKSCDNCGRLKDAVNHWWSLWANIKTKSLFIKPMDEHLYDGSPGFISLNACGLECLSILESKIKEGVNPLK